MFCNQSLMDNLKLKPQVYNMKNTFINLILFFTAFPVLAVDGDTQSISIFGRMKGIAGTGGYETESSKPILEYAGNIIAILLGLLGVIFVFLIILAGYHWMMAGGDSGKIEKAKDEMWRAVIGLLIIVGAYAIQQYVFTRI